VYNMNTELGDFNAKVGEGEDHILKTNRWK
jgi:hypothetical protein